MVGEIFEFCCPEMAKTTLKIFFDRRKSESEEFHYMKLGKKFFLQSQSIKFYAFYAITNLLCCFSSFYAKILNFMLI